MNNIYKKMYLYAFTYTYAYIKTLLAIKGGAGSGNFGHAGRPGLVGGSADGFNSDRTVNHAPGKAGDIVSKGRFHPERGGYLYHGTTMPNDEKYLIPDKDGVVYLTDDYKEAEGYANGVALSQNYGGTPRVVAINLTSGQMVNIQNEIDEAVSNGDDFTAIFNEMRSQGYDYAFYLHPSNFGADEQYVIVALNPDSTLGNITNMFTWVIR